MIAFGIMVFAVVALIGLISVALNAGKHSQVDTLESMVAQEVVTCLHTNALANWDSLSFPKTYFDYAGKPLTNSIGAYFACQISSLSTDPATESQATNSFRRFQLTILSQAASPTPTTNVFQSAIAKPQN